MVDLGLLVGQTFDIISLSMGDLSSTWANYLLIWTSYLLIYPHILLI